MVRLPLVTFAVIAMTTAMIAFVVRLADRRSDFMFGPDGVAHIGLFVSKSLLWADIGTLNLVRLQRRFLFFKKPISEGRVAEFTPRHGHGAMVRARSKFAALLSLFQTSRIGVDLDAFGMTPEQFEKPMLFLHPGLKVTREVRVRWR